MKLEELTALGVPEEQAKQVVSLHEKELGKAVSGRDGLKAENEALKNQLSERDQDIASLKASAGSAEEIGKKLSQLEQKYETDMKKFQDQIAARDYSDAVRGAIEGKQIHFSSKAAERAFIADLQEKKLRVDGGKLLGFGEFLEAQKSADPAAFADADKPPRYTRGSNESVTPPMTRDSFLSLPYTKQLEFKTANPELFNTMMRG